MDRVINWMITPNQEGITPEQKIWKLPPSADRAKLRSKTFEGIARAMAEQWGDYVLSSLK